MQNKIRPNSPLLLCLLITASLSAQTNVLTQHNDIGRTGQNLTETILTPANVSAANSFGKLYSANLDGRTWAQPLYVSSVTIGGANHSVVYVATSHDSIYALDANANGAVLWKASLLDQAHGATAGAIPDPQGDTGCGDNDSAEYGVVGTPVINYSNATTGTLYVVSITYEGNYPVQRLHALDITTGAEQAGSPVTIAASAAGTGSGSVNGVVSFDPKWENQRPGLLLLNGTVYLAWGSHCDAGPWHGWLMGYDAGTLKQTSAFITSPNSGGNGIWMSGAGLAADNHGASGGLANGKGTAPRLFLVTGNGGFDASADWGESVLNLNVAGTTPKVTDSFTVGTQASLTQSDTDLGSAGTMLVPDQPGATYPHLAVQLSKSGELYLLNRDNLGGYNTNADQVFQEFSFGPNPYGIWGTPAYFNGSLYFWAANSNMQQYTLNVPASGAPSLSLASQGSYTEPGTQEGYYVGTYFGATPSISANGTSNGIVWANDTVRDQGNPIQYLYAYDARNVTTPLWTSRQNPGRDFAGGSQKFGVPTVADGKVFLTSDSQLQVYGLLPSNFASYNLSAFQPLLSVVPGASASTQITITPVGSFSGTVTLTASGLPAGVTAAFSSAGSGASTLTLTAASSAAATTSPATVTITGTSGSMSQSITITVSVSPTPGPVAVNLASVANVYGTSLNNVNPTNGGFDTEGWAYSANLLGPSVSSLGVPFYFGQAGLANAVSSITVPLPAGNFNAIYLAGAAINGSQTNQSFVVNYSDSSSTTFTQNLSDWCGPRNYPGETTSLAMTYRLSPGSGTSALACNVYAYTFNLNSAKTVSSITLPSNRNTAFLAITLAGASAAPGPQAQTITFGPIPAQSLGGSLTVNASASSGLPVSLNLVPNGNCSLSGNVVTFLNVGNCGVVASQAGNARYAAAPAVGQIIVVNNAAAQTITFAAISAQQANTSIALKAAASSGLAVSFTSETQNVCSVSGTTATLSAAGSCTITASQAGNNVYSAATPVTQTFTVNAASATPVTVTIPAASLATGNYNTFTATISGLSNAPTALGLGGVACVNVPGCTVNLGGSIGLLNFEFFSVTNTSATLGVYVSTSLLPGSYVIPITLGSTTVGTFALTVPGSGGFTLATGSTITLTPGTGGTMPINVTPASGFSGTVQYSMSGLPANSSDAFVPNGSVNSTLVIYCQPSVAPGTYNLVLSGWTGTAGGSVVLQLIVP